MLGDISTSSWSVLHAIKQCYLSKNSER